MPKQIISHPLQSTRCDVFIFFYLLFLILSLGVEIMMKNLPFYQNQMGKWMVDLNFVYNYFDASTNFVKGWIGVRWVANNASHLEWLVVVIRFGAFFFFSFSFKVKKRKVKKLTHIGTMRSWIQDHLGEHQGFGLIQLAPHWYYICKEARMKDYSEGL